jgi:predicted DNA-binding antitoxin AbrB/MazE fold protein
MTTVIEATFDGTVFHPRKPVDLPANTAVKLVIEEVVPPDVKSSSFLQVAQSLHLDGPADWSENLR